MFVLMLSFLISFFFIRYNRYRNYHNYALILDENDKLKEEHKQIRKEFMEYEKRADKINEYLGVKNIDNVEKVEKVDYQALTNKEMVAILNSKTLLAYNKIDERKEHIKKSVKKLGISKITYNKLIKTAKISKEDAENVDSVMSSTIDGSSIGGHDDAVDRIKVVKNVPFLKVSDDAINNRNYARELDDMVALEKTLQSLPFGKPTNGDYHVTSTYGFREDPVKKDGRIRIHKGIDIVLHNDNVVVPKDGVVKFAGVKSGYGNCIDIEHQIEGMKSKVITHYAHLKKINVKKGQQVNGGDIIGIQGSTGHSTGPHLHYEIQINGQAVNPINFMKVKEI